MIDVVRREVLAGLKATLAATRAQRHVFLHIHPFCWTPACPRRLALLSLTFTLDFVMCLLIRRPNDASLKLHSENSSLQDWFPVLRARRIVEDLEDQIERTLTVLVWRVSVAFAPAAKNSYRPWRLSGPINCVKIAHLHRSSCQRRFTLKPFHEMIGNALFCKLQLSVLYST